MTTILLLMMLTLRPATRPRWSQARGNRVVPSTWRTTHTRVQAQADRSQSRRWAALRLLGGQGEGPASNPNSGTSYASIELRGGRTRPRAGYVRATQRSVTDEHECRAQRHPDMHSIGATDDALVGAIEHARSYYGSSSTQASDTCGLCSGEPTRPQGGESEEGDMQR